MIRLHGQIRWSYHIAFSRGELKWEAPMIGIKQLFHIIIILCIPFCVLLCLRGRVSRLVSCELSIFYSFVLADVSFQKNLCDLFLPKQNKKSREESVSGGKLIG
jgi:hypothetical protein